MRFWQNVLRATAVTLGWNGYGNKSHGCQWSVGQTHVPLVSSPGEDPSAATQPLAFLPATRSRNELGTSYSALLYLLLVFLLHRSFCWHACHTSSGVAAFARSCVAEVDAASTWPRLPAFLSLCSANYSVQDSIQAHGKAHMRSDLSKKFPQRCFWNSSNVRPVNDGPLSSFSSICSGWALL